VGVRSQGEPRSGEGTRTLSSVVPMPCATARSGVTGALGVGFAASPSSDMLHTSRVPAVRRKKFRDSKC
jgi:hypothetical protein